jgi:hypothetical protein
MVSGWSKSRSDTVLSRMNGGDKQYIKLLTIFDVSIAKTDKTECNSPLILRIFFCKNLWKLKLQNQLEYSKAVCSLCLCNIFIFQSKSL